MAAMEITIEKLIYGGEGLAHHDGSTVFVPYVLPAERVAVAEVERKKKFVRARVEKVVEASAERTTPRCVHFGTCGGCDYQHIPYDAQLRYKVDILRETLRRIGRIDWTGEIVAHASPPWGYRNRAQWKVRPLGEVSAEAETRLGIGYFRASSTALCVVDDCAILSPLLAKTLAALREALASGTLPRKLREVEAFAGAEDAKLLLTATFSGFPAGAAELAEKIREMVPETESLLFHDPTRDRMALDGPGFVEVPVEGRAYRVGHFSFFQVNRFLAGELVRTVVEMAGSGRLALDLYAGVGLFSAPLMARFAHVVAVESNPAAARDLEANVSKASARGGAAVEARSSDVEPFLAKFRGDPEFVLLDPPRAGASPAAIKQLLRIAPAWLAYVSCDPPTFARDLAALVAGGYEIAEVHLFDLFPQTFHLEAVARLRRRP
jgi:23S rRNA (uracil1939-C5)-methyltransferase